eukprot:scaffold181990_cov18-Prasinocladus_malaysianus.AAC.1
MESIVSTRQYMYDCTMLAQLLTTANALLAKVTVMPGLVAVGAEYDTSLSLLGAPTGVNAGRSIGPTNITAAIIKETCSDSGDGLH